MTHLDSRHQVHRGLVERVDLPALLDDHTGGKRGKQRGEFLGKPPLGLDLLLEIGVASSQIDGESLDFG